MNNYKAIETIKANNKQTKEKKIMDLIEKYHGQTACAKIIQAKWPNITIGSPASFEAPDNMKEKLRRGLIEEYYLTNKGTWNELATLDNTLYHTITCSKYECAGNQMQHDGTWYFAMIICSGVFKDVCGTAWSANKRDAEAACISELLHNMLVMEREQQADVEEPSTVSLNSTSIVAAVAIDKDETTHEHLDMPVEDMSTEPAFRPQQLSERWIQLDVVHWRANGLNGAAVKKWDLPVALRETQPTPCDSLIMAQWRVNRMQRTDMVIRFAAPAQKFLSGMLYAKFYYGARADKNIESRYNKYAMSQGHRVTIRPGSANHAELRIPFNHHNGMITNHDNMFDSKTGLYIGTLVLTEVAPLGAPTGTTPAIDISVLISFENAVLTSRVAGNMLPLAVDQQGLISEAVNSSAAAPIVGTLEDIEKMMHAMRKTSDEDKPMDPTARIMVVPRYMETMSAGTNIDDQLLSMRLDQKGKKPSVLKRTGNELYGMLRTQSLYRQFAWSTSDEYGKLLTSFPVEAVNAREHYQEITFESNGTTHIGYAVPASDIVASCFTYTSGSPEYTFEPVCTDFHVGILRVVMVPLVEESFVPARMLDTNNVKVDYIELGKQVNEVMVKADFHNVNTVIATRSGARGSVTPRRPMAMCYVYVQSALQSSASQNILVNIYKRGGKDFEVIEMKNAVLSPAWSDEMVLDPAAVIINFDGRTDFYTGVESRIFDGDNAVLHYAGVNDNATTWDIHNRNWTFALIAGMQPANLVPDDGTGFPPAYWTHAGWMQHTGIVTHIGPEVWTYGYRRVLVWRYPGYRGNSAVAFPIPEVRRSVASPNWVPLPAHYFEGLNRIVQRWTNEYPNNNINQALRDFLIFTSTAMTTTFAACFAPSTESGLLNLGDYLRGAFEQQGAGANQVASGSVNEKRRTDWGQKLFGEQGGDLYAILRRPWYVTNFTYNPTKDPTWPYARASAQLSHWCPPRDFGDPVHFANRWPTQMILCLGYTYVSGSVTRRIMGSDIAGTVMWANHKFFDKPNESFAVKVYSAPQNAPTWKQGLPNEVADLNINSHLHVNAAWKNENERNFMFERADNLDPNSQQCFDIGIMDIGFQATRTGASDDIHTISLYTAFGDDAELSQFRGFPPMVFNADLEDVPLQMKAPLPPLEPFLAKQLMQCGDVESNPGPVQSRFEQQGVGDWVSAKALSAMGVEEKFAEVKELLINLAAQESETMQETLMAKVSQTCEQIEDTIKGEGFSRLRGIMLGEGIHFIANPNMNSIIATIVNLLVQLGLFAYETSTHIKQVLEDLFIGSVKQPEYTRVEENSVDQEAYQPTEPFIDAIETFISVLLTSVCSYIGWKNPVIKSLDWKIKLAMAVPSFCGMGFSVKRFIHGLVPTIKWCFEYVIYLKAQYVDDAIAGFMHTSSNFIGQWAAEVNDVCKPNFDTSTLENRDRIFLAYNIAIALETRVMNKTTRFAALKTPIEKIKAKRQAVVEDGFTPAVRQEPFSMWIYGPPGVGKSTAIDGIVSNLILKNNIYVPNGEMTLIASATSQYLNRVKGQPELRIDDFFAVTDPNIAAAQVSYVFDCMTAAAYCPNQAAVEKKDQLYSPSIFTILCNAACPVGLPVANYHAFLRRRDVTIHVTGNTLGLINEFGDEFKEELKKVDHIYGELPSKMKENNKHLVFNFVKVDNLGNAHAIPGVKKDMMYEEALAYIEECYKRRTLVKSASYVNRLGQFYRARGQNVPDFSQLLEQQDIDLERVVSHWIAEVEGDTKVIRELEARFKPNEVNTATAAEMFNNMKHTTLSKILSERYKIKTQQTGEDSPTTSNDTFIRWETAENGDASSNEYHMNSVGDLLRAYNADIRDEVQKVMHTLLVTKDDQAVLERDGNLVPLSYALLEHATCQHCTKNKSKAEMRAILRKEMCITNCWLPVELNREVMSHYFLMVEDDVQAYNLHDGWLRKYTLKVRSAISYAWDCIRDTGKKLYQKIKIFGVSIYDFLCTHWKTTVAITCGVLGMMLYLYKASTEDSYIMKVMPDGKLKTATGHVINSGKKGVDNILSLFTQQAYNPKVRSTFVNVQSKYAATEGAKTQQSGGLGDISEDDLRIINNAFIPMLCDMKPEWGKERWATSAFAYGGHKAIMTRHEWEIMSTYAIRVHYVINQNKGEVYSVESGPEELNWKEFEHYKHNSTVRTGNFGTIDLPVNVPQRKSLITKKHSWFQNENTTNSFSGVLITPTFLQEGGMGNVVYTLDYDYADRPERTKPMTVSGEAVTTATIYSDNYIYRVSKKGYCAAILYDLGSRKIVGMHYGGDTRVGISERILTSYLPRDKFEHEEMSLRAADDTFDAINGTVLCLGHVARSEVHQQASDSKIMESAIHGVVEVRTGRAQLKATTWSPLYEGVAKHGKPTINFPPKHVEAAARDLTNVILRARPILRDTKGGMRLLTTSEAIFGIPGVINSIDITTSCGFGWRLGSGGKKSIINLVDRTISKELASRVTTMEEKFAEGIIPFVLAVDCLKDETLPLAKIQKVGHTRIISTLPVEYQIILRKYVLPFVVSYHAYNLETENAIGLAVSGPHEMQFDRLGRMMEGRIVAGDFSNFGPGANAVVAKACLGIIVEWYRSYGADEKFVRTIEAVLSPLICTPHLAYDKVYRTCGGIISGSAITVELNSLIHCMYMRIAALGMGITLSEFNAEVTLVTYGDDGLAKVSLYLLDRFNVATLKEFFAKYNIKYTAVDKSDSVVPHTSLEETSFLKHAFKKYDGRYMAALDKASVENQINWISTVGSIKQNTLVNCLMALSQAFPHGRDYYEALHKKIALPLVKVGVYAHLPSFDDARVERYQKTTGEQTLANNLQELKQGLTGRQIDVGKDVFETVAKWHLAGA